MMKTFLRNKFDLQLLATIPVQTTSANTHDYTSADLDDKTNFGKLLEPGFRKIFFETYDELPAQFPKIYNVQYDDGAEVKEWGMGAFTDWVERADHYDTVAYQKLSPGLERRYVHKAFTSGFQITREMYEDQMYRQMEKFPSALARAGRAKVEKDAITTLTGGFANTGYDGKPLFANDHPLLDSVKVGNNLATGPLNEANLKIALQTMRETVDEAGNLIQLRATRLIIPPALEDTAIRTLASELLPGTSLNDTNKFLTARGMEIVVMDYLGEAAGGSDTAWFLQDGSRHELNFFWRTAPEFASDNVFDNYVQKYKGYMRYSYGYSDWRGVIGSQGTAPVGP